MNDKRIYPITPALPLLWYFNNLLAIVAFLTLLILGIFLIIHFLRNKTKKKSIFDKKTKISCLWLVTAVVFLITFRLTFFYHYFYVVSLLVLSILLLINLVIGKRYSLFRVRSFYWIMAIIFFIGSTIVSFINIPKGYEVWQQTKELEIIFEEIILGLPKPPIVDKEIWHTQSISYYVPKDGEQLVNFYRSSLLNNNQWHFLDEERGRFNHDLYYQKANEDKWLLLNFDWTSPDNKIKIQGRDYPFTYLTIYFYNNKPCLPSDKNCPINNPLYR
jgi:hypothetical protein